VDIRLKQWAEDQLPSKSVQVGWELLKEKFEDFLAKAKASKNHDSIFDHLKESVVEEAVRRHHWEVKVNLYSKHLNPTINYYFIGLCIH